MRQEWYWTVRVVLSCGNTCARLLRPPIPFPPTSAPPPPPPPPGTFTITFYGQTVRVQWDVSAVDMATALNSLSTINSVSVSRNRNAHGHTWLITFVDMPYPGSLYNQVGVVWHCVVACCPSTHARTRTRFVRSLNSH
jgi:hypothetical protein